MNISIAVFIFIISATSMLGQATWLKVYGGDNDDYGASITIAPSGGFFVHGMTFSNTLTFNALQKGGGDGYLLKLQSNGEVSWAVTLGGSSNDDARSVSNMSGDGALAVGFTRSNDGDYLNLGKGGSGEDFSVNKVNGDGTIAWSKLIGTTEGDVGIEGVETSDGSFVIVGRVCGNDADFSGNLGGCDAGFAKLNSDGTIAWTKLLGGSGSDYAMAIANTPDGGFVATGWTDSNDGTFSGMTLGGEDIFVIKFNADGSIDWKTNLGGSGIDGSWWDEYGTSILTLADGSVVISGTTVSNDGTFAGLSKGGRDGFVVKLDNQGEVVWSTVIGGTGSDQVIKVAAHPDGGFVLAGHTTSNDGDFTDMSNGSTDAFLMKLTSEGNISWEKVFGGTQDDFGLSVAVHSDGRLALAGTCNSNNGSFASMNKGGSDIFVALIEDDACPVSITSHPANASVSGGHTVSLSVTATSSTTLTYQWQRFNGSSYVNISDGDEYSGTTSSTLKVASALISKKGPYRCAVTSNWCTVNSNDATLDVQCPCNE